MFDDLPGFEELPDTVQQQLQAICRRRFFKAGQTIAEAGAPSDSIGIVRDGILRMQKTLYDGRQHVVGLLVDGDSFGRLFSGTMHFSVEAATDSEVYMFPLAQFEVILQNSTELDRLMLVNLVDELDRARDWMIILANTKIRKRLAGFLLMICTSFQNVDHLIIPDENAIKVRIPISRPDLAYLLGTRVESISRGLHALAADGLIEILRSDLIKIPRIDDLLDEFGEPDLFDPISLDRLMKNVRKSPD